MSRRPRVFGVERRVLAHENAVELPQRGDARLPERVPGSRIGAHRERPHACASFAVAQGEVALLEVEELEAVCLRGDEHREGGVLRVLDLRDRIHDDGQAARCFHGVEW